MIRFLASFFVLSFARLKCPGICGQTRLKALDFLRWESNAVFSHFNRFLRGCKGRWWKNEDAGGGWRTGWRGSVECLQSCRVNRKGESGGKNSFGDSLALVECAADAKLASLAKHRRTPRSPAESFPPPSPGSKSHRTEDRGRIGPYAIRTSAG